MNAPFMVWNIFSVITDRPWWLKREAILWVTNAIAADGAGLDNVPTLLTSSKYLGCRLMTIANVLVTASHLLT